MIHNPFLHALASYGNIPDPELRPYFWDVLMTDWHDLEHNANPIEAHVMPSHEVALYITNDQPIDADPSDVDVVRVLSACAVAFHLAVNQRLPLPAPLMFDTIDDWSYPYIAVNDCEFNHTGATLAFGRADQDAPMSITFDYDDLVNYI